MRLNLIKRQARNQYYEDPLAEGILPLRMLLISDGTFLMGSPEDELDRSSSESPQHKVNVSSFFMGKYPVTQAQWRAVAALPQASQELDLDPSHFKGDKRPVEQVSWHDAVEFCARLSIFTNREYRLPTEAEWEYACRAGTTTPFHFGETITTDLANYDGTDDPDGNWSGSYSQGAKGEYREETTPVDHFEGANEYGLCDMHGNVWEWCQDHWHDNYEGAPIDGSACLTGNEDESRVLRGGSWDFNPRDCRSAYRSYYMPDYRTFNIGFRVVCSAPRRNLIWAKQEVVDYLRKHANE
jgi:formylglycine-generating enzyme required for sulfatase activity